MDKAALVKEATGLVQLLDEAGEAPKGAMLVHNQETDSWRLWIVPSDALTNKMAFYSKVSSLIVDNQEIFFILDAGDIDLREANHPAIEALARMVHAEGCNEIYLGNNNFNGFYLPGGILIRMAL